MTKSPLLQHVLLVGLLGLSGCIGNPALKDQGATRELIQSSGSYCGGNAFRQVVHPQLRANCANCHGGAGPGVGSFAAYDVGVAYQQSRARVDLGSPAGSFLVSKSIVAGHGTNCTSCGSSWGQTLTALILEWGKAESGDAITCQNYQYAPEGGGSGSASPFELGPYTPPRPENTIVIPEGLAVYSAASGVHSILRNNCAQCHIAGGLASFAPFAVSDATASYREAKPRSNFASIDLSLLISRANTPNHGGSCSVCGNAGFVSDLRTQMNLWAAQESVGVENNRVKLVSKSIAPLPGGTTDKVIIWDLATETVPPQPSLAGASFSIRVRMASGSTTTYRFSDPRLVAGGTAIRAQELSFVLNDVVNTSVTTYHPVDQVVVAGQNLSLSSTPALLSSVNTATDVIAISFGYLKLNP